MRAQHSNISLFKCVWQATAKLTHFSKTIKIFGGEPPLSKRGIARQVSLEVYQISLLPRITKLPMSYRLVSKFPQDTQSLGQAFLKACGFQRQSLWWVLRAKPLTCLAPKGGQSPPLLTNVADKRNFLGGERSSHLREQDRLRALPLKPMRDFVPQPCKLLKKLEQNF